VKITEDVANVLGNSRIEETKLYLPDVQLERKLYLAVDKVLKAVGGKWNRKEKAHLFRKSPSEIVEEILLTGEYTDAKKEYQFFETPTRLARALVAWADIRKGEMCLEPSAGRGAIAQYLPDVDCVELVSDNRDYLTTRGFSLVGDDFLNFSRPYDVIVANPPFTRQQDIEHVTHMISLARRTVVSVMSNSILFRTNRKTVEFRELLKKCNGKVIRLAADSFKESGTGVNTCAVKCEGKGGAKNVDSD